MDKSAVFGLSVVLLVLFCTTPVKACTCQLQRIPSIVTSRGKAWQTWPTACFYK
ncbi:hypothetical protein ACRRTK_013842 [Alexandromys fortis]